MAAEKTAGKGFALPPPQSQPQQPSLPAPAQSNVARPQEATGNEASSKGMSLVVPDPAKENTDVQMRDYAIGGGILLVLLIAFFFAKNAYSNHLAKKKVSPGASNAAGWWLFIFLASLAVNAILVVINPVKFSTLFVVAPLGVISLVSLVLVFVSGRRG